MARQEQRAKILEAAEALFRHFGVKKTSMDDIARRVGVSKPIIYRHFDSKDDLLFAVIDGMGDRHQEAAFEVMQDVEGYADKLRTVTRYMLERFRELSLDGAISVGLLRRLRDWGFTHQKPLLMDLINEGIAAGEFRPVNVELLQHGWHGAMMAVAIEAASRESVDEAYLGVNEMNEILIQGLIKRN